MIRVFGLFSFSVLLLTGCGDSPQPVRRETAIVPAEADPHGSVSPRSHGEMPSNPHDEMPSSPHGEMPPPPRGSVAGGSELDSPVVQLGGMVITAPQEWARLRPKPSMFAPLAEFSLPRAEGDGADGRLTITLVGGSVEANLDRWRQQFGGKPDQESRQDLEISGIKVAAISLSGTYNTQHGGMGVVEQAPDYQMRAAIFAVRSRQCVVKAYGPKRTMAKHAEAYDAFLQSLRASPSKPAGPSNSN